MNNHQFTITFFGQAEMPLVREKISAVFLIAFSDEKVLSIRNERGWDIPGGYLEAGEELLEGLRREVAEEAGASFETAHPYAILSSSGQEKVMVFYVSPSCTLGKFTSSEDALDRDLLSVEGLISRYYGDRNLLRSLIEEARHRV